MRHVRTLTEARQSKANEFQDFICAFSGAFSAIIAAFGGTSPITEYIDSKCAFDVPDNGGDSA